MKIFITLLVIFCTCSLYGQESYSYFYRVYFRDKGVNTASNYAPEKLLSDRALARRQNAGISVPDNRDIPVYKNYIDEISSLGYKLHCTSKWMNTALFKTLSPSDIVQILNLPFVSKVQIVKTAGKKKRINDKLDFQIEQSDDPSYDRPVEMVNGYSMHNSGYYGNNILIAVLDGGFINADQISSLSSLRNRNGIKATYDFVNNNEHVYDYSTHGTAVLSVLSGQIPGMMEGTAPGADYLLIRTEDTESEFPCEEDFWAAGAEYADSAGADIISSSLGYYNFDDPEFNYKYSDMDGNSAFVTVVADIAASKGILVVNSAGNERNKEWKYILSPADGDSVLAIGAVDGNNIISTFSSSGPSADGRIKPDLVTMGVSVPVQTSESSTGRSNGTSFSCPVLSGMAACLMEAVPTAINTEIINALKSSADRYNFPDSLYGFGIPDMDIALTKLQDLYAIVPDTKTVAGPNPTTGNIEITFRESPEHLEVEIFSMTGKIVFKKYFSSFAGRILHLTELQNSEQGIYFIRLKTESGIMVHKIIKLRN